MRLIEVAHRVRRRVWRVLRPATRGVKVMVRNAAGEVLLVRNSYGDVGAWVLPGGGVRPFERPEACARRELWEEARCRLVDLAVVGDFTSTLEGKRDVVTLFLAQADDAPAIGSREIAEVGFFDPTAPPPGASPATLRRLGELTGARERSAAW